MSKNVNLKKGLFFVIEGIDGSGKSTQLKLLSASLADSYDVVVTKEPTEESEYGRKIRESMHKGERFPIDEELKLFMRDRKEHLERLIIPALNAKKIVVCDRYYYSNIAYQGASGLDINEIRQKNEEFSVIPDAVFYLKVDVEEGLHRVQNIRNSELTSFEKVDYLKKVSGIFDTMDFDYFHTIDAKRSAKEVSEDIIKIAVGIISANRSE
jgi:dTMP kinase